MVVRGSGKNERVETYLGMGGDVVMETGPAGQGGAGLGRKGKLTWLLLGGLLSPALALALTPLLLQPLVPAPALALLLFMGPGWGGGGGSSSSPGTDRLVGRRGEGQGYCLGGSHRTRGGGWAGGGSEAGPPQTQ